MQGPGDQSLPSGNHAVAYPIQGFSVFKGIIAVRNGFCECCPDMLDVVNQTS